MSTDKQRLFSLAVVVVAAVVFGMVVAGALNITPRSEAERQPAAVVEAVPASAPDFVSLADRVVPSVVSVFTTDVEEEGERRSMPRDPFHFFFGPPQGESEEEPSVRRSSGSGFFISDEGELLTNYHVVEGADQLEIELEDGTRYEAKVVGTDPETDLALLKVEKGGHRFVGLVLGDSEQLRVGEWVMAVGNPLNMDHTVTVGVVSAKGRVLGLTDSSFESFIQTDAAINLGNSGGPLVNTRGEVVGINTAINIQGQNLGFAVPVDIARRILKQLRESGTVVRGYMGVMVRNVDQRIAEAFGLSNRDGAFVDAVVPKHAGDKAGVRPGDVIVKVDDLVVKDTRTLIDEVSARSPGSSAELEVIREGARKTLKVTLEQRQLGDEREETGHEGGERDSTERVGISMTELTEHLRQVYGIADEMVGVLVSGVKPMSPAGEEGLLRGDVILKANGREVATPDELAEIIDAVEPGGYLKLYVHRPRAEQSFFVILKLEE